MPCLPRSIALGAAAVFVSGCGGSLPADSSPPAAAAPARSTPFPKPRGATLAELAGPFPTGPRLAPFITVLEPGRRRFAFRMYDRRRKQLGDAPVAVYVAAGADQEAHGPYPARFLSRVTNPRTKAGARHRKRKRARPSWQYVARLRFPRAGTYSVLALIRLDGRLVAARAVDITVMTSQQR